jgi:hypothetical protein
MTTAARFETGAPAAPSNVSFLSWSGDGLTVCGASGVNPLEN